MIFMRFYSFPFFVRLAHISICRLGIFFFLVYFLLVPFSFFFSVFSDVRVLMRALFAAWFLLQPFRGSFFSIPPLNC